MAILRGLTVRIPVMCRKREADPSEVRICLPFYRFFFLPYNMDKTRRTVYNGIYNNFRQIPDIVF